MSRVSFWDTECEHEDAKVGSTNLEFARLLADDGMSAAAIEKHLGGPINSLAAKLKGPVEKKPAAAKPTFNDNWQASIDALNKRVGELEATNASLESQRAAAYAEVASLKAKLEAAEKSHALDAPPSASPSRDAQDRELFIEFKRQGPEFELFRQIMAWQRECAARAEG